MESDKSDGSSNTAGQSTAVDDQVAEEKLERARKNKERALELRKSRNRAHPYSKPSSSSSVTGGNPVSHVRTPNTNSSASSLRDSHAGYIIEDEPTDHAPVYRVVEESGESSRSWTLYVVGSLLWRCLWDLEPQGTAVVSRVQPRYYKCLRFLNPLDTDKKKNNK